MSRDRYSAARAALRTTLLAFVTRSSADALTHILSRRLETAVDVFGVLRSSPELAEHVAFNRIDTVAEMAGLAWLRALADATADTAPRQSRMARFAAQVAAGVDPKDAARDARDGGEA